MLKVHAKQSNSVEVLCLEGQIVSGETDVLRSAVQWASDASDIILDLSNVTRVDAHGLGVLLEIREQTLANGIHFELINVNENLSRVFEITRLDTVFEINSGFAFIPLYPQITQIVQNNLCNLWMNKLGHSERNATSGSTRVARRAGM